MTSPNNGNIDPGNAMRRFIRSMQESQFAAPGAFTQSRPLTDPQNQTSAALHSANVTARVVFGLITDCTAIGNTYRVQFEKMKQPVVAIYGGHTTNSAFGSREVTTLQPGTPVACIWHEQLPYAQILYTLPPFGSSAHRNQHSIIHGASRARVDEAHKRPFRMDSAGYIPAALAGRPFDAITCGETGWITETGLKAFVDSFMALFGVDEACQISFHYHDQLARLAAYQFQLWTATQETESLNDEDETADWSGYAMYPWEQLGLAARGDPTIIREAAAWQLNEPYYSKMEPLDDRLMPWHRERIFHGYLGQGGKRCVIAPAVEFTDSGDRGSTSNNTTGAGTRTQFTSYAGGQGVTDAKHPGLFDEFTTADGRHCIQSAKGISITKRSAIMLPTRRRRPEDPEGDTAQNYRASGVLGSGAQHAITGDIETHGTYSGHNRALGVLDLHAYIFNYAGTHPFFYHAKDYYLPEESDAEWADGKSAEVPNYGELATSMYLQAEPYKKTWKIDHRYDVQDFYTLSSGIDLLDDGGVLIYDGYGGSLRMSGGSIELAAPGDIWLKSGRNVNVWAGADAVIRAKHSWDITATEADGRIKAEKNLMLLSGNGGTGGTLIESRGTGSEFNFEDAGENVTMGGVILRSPYAPITTWASSVYLRTGGGDISDGPIIIDAGRGKGLVLTYGSTQHNYLNSGEYWHFGTTEEQVSGPSACITRTSTVIPSTLRIGGTTVVAGGLVVDGVVASTSAFAAVSAPLVGKLEGEGLQKIQETLTESKEVTQKTLPANGQQIMDSVLTKNYYEEHKPGNDDVILKGQFGFRTTADYQTQGFQLFEDLWQQLGRLTGKASARWQERPVTYQGQQSYPYPGQEAFQGDTLLQQNLTLFDADAGRSKDRGDQPNLVGVYRNPTFGTPQPTSLDSYLVIR